MTIDERMDQFQVKLNDMKNELADIIDLLEDEHEDEDMIDALTEALDALEDASDAVAEALE